MGAIGVFLGVVMETNEKIVGTAEGVFAVYSVRRKPDMSRYDAEIHQEVRGVPWDPNPGAASSQTLPAPILHIGGSPEPKSTSSVGKNASLSVKLFLLPN